MAGANTSYSEVVNHGLVFKGNFFETVASGTVTCKVAGASQSDEYPTAAGNVSTTTPRFGMIKLGSVFGEILIPEMTDYHEDPVIQGGQHILLNGSARSDEFGERTHFFIGFLGLSETDYALLQSAWNAPPPLRLITNVGIYNVVRGNHAPKVYDKVGNISTSIELDESE